MDIQIIGSNCAKIVLSAEECAELGISYEGFVPDSLTARFFLASVLAKLEIIGASVKNSEKLTAEIFENESGGLTIYISGKRLNIEVSEQERQVQLLKTPEEVIRAAKQLDDDGSALLYRYNGGYVLVDDNDDSIISAKVKEHGKLLSDAPKKYLSEL